MKAPATFISNFFSEAESSTRQRGCLACPVSSSDPLDERTESRIACLIAALIAIYEPMSYVSHVLRSFLADAPLSVMYSNPQAASCIDTLTPRQHLHRRTSITLSFQLIDQSNCLYADATRAPSQSPPTGIYFTYSYSRCSSRTSRSRRPRTLPLRAGGLALIFTALPFYSPKTIRPTVRKAISEQHS